MTKHTDQPTGATAQSTTRVTAESTATTDATELTALLQEVNQLFPPITDDLADGRTRKGKEQRRQIAQREAYIKALMAGIYHATIADRLRQEFDLIMVGHQTDTASYEEQIANLKRLLGQTGQFMLVAFQLALLLRRRPEFVTKQQTYGETHAVNLNLGDLKVSVFGDNQSIQLTAPGLRPRSFGLDSQGNLHEGDLDRMIGYLVRAGYDIDPENAKKALSQAAQGRYYADPYTSKADAMSSAIGRIAMQGAGITEDYLSDIDPVALMRNKPSAVDAMTDALQRQFGDDASGVSLRKPPVSMFAQRDRGRRPMTDLGLIYIVTDGMSHPGDQNG